jgi:hypothetical protein
VGNDVPKITLQRNDRLQIGVSRATDNMGYAGYLEDLEICTDDNCQHWTTVDVNNTLDVNNPLVVKETRIKIKYDSDKTVSDWFILDEIRGFQCNNRGTCMDDTQHQELQTENGFNWQATCTKSTDQMCNTHDDCKVSQNCKGTCDGIELPKNPFWENWNVQGQDGLGRLCASDDECLGHQVAENVTKVILAAQEAGSYTHILQAATNDGKNTLPRVAAALDVSPILDILTVESEDTFTRPMYAGNAIATVQSSDSVKVSSHSWCSSRSKMWTTSPLF